MAVSLNGDGTITGLSTLSSVTITGLTSLTTTDLTADTTTLVVDSANNRVGIGTASPSTTLQVVGTATATAFSGPLTGNVTGDVSGNAGTVTNGVYTTDIGSTVQAYDADLTTLAGLSSADGNFIVGSATGWVVESGATVRTSLGLGTAATTASTDYATAAQGTTADSALQPGDIGSTVQAYDADLTTLAGLSSADGNFIVGSATGWVVESGATVRTSLGLGTAATTASTDYATAAQGTTADSALQPGDNISTLTNNSGFITGNQTITLSGDASGSGTTAITVTVADNSHNHTSANISDATSANTANTIVERDASGNFSAGTITAALTGNASTATTLQTARTINGVSFNGSANIVAEPYVEDDEATAATRLLTFVDNSTAGYKRLNEDSSLTYNPSTNTLTAGAFVGDGSGLTGISAGGGFSNMDIITASGTWTNPGSVTKVKVTVVGGGGAGASAYGIPGDTSNGGGGGAGGHAIEYITIPTSPVPVTIGTGGTTAPYPYPSPWVGTPGSTSSFGAYCSATGGVRGTGSAPGTTEGIGGDGGTGSGGLLNFTGRPGHPGYTGVGPTPAGLNNIGAGGVSIFGGYSTPNSNQGLNGNKFGPAYLYNGSPGGLYGNGGKANGSPRPTAGSYPTAGAPGVILVEY